MKKVFLLVLSLLLLTSCAKLELNPEWYPHGWAGKDTIFVARPNGKFSIGQYYTNQALAVNTDEGMHDGLLSSVTDHKRSGNKVYVYADEGYCVIDEKSNTAEVLITVEDADTHSRVNDPAVTYLTSFDDFSDKAKKIFRDMEEYWSDKDYRRYGSHDKIYPDGTIVYSALWRILVVGPVVAVHILIFAVIIFFLMRPIKQKKKK